MNLNDSEMSVTLTKVKQLLGNVTLAEQLETVVKHLPTYTKIIKTHINQLQQVLATDKHNNKNLDSINLSHIVKQLMEIFDNVQSDDLQILEELQNCALTWKQEEKVAEEVS